MLRQTGLSCTERKLNFAKMKQTACNSNRHFVYHQYVISSNARVLYIQIYIVTCGVGRLFVLISLKRFCATAFDLSVDVMLLKYQIWQPNFAENLIDSVSVNKVFPKENISLVSF